MARSGRSGSGARSKIRTISYTWSSADCGRLTTLPENLETSLLLLERGYYLACGGKMETGILPGKVLELFRRLDAAKIDWVLVGAEAVNIYLLRPRATVDVDILVRKKDLQKMGKILRETCGEFQDTESHLQATLAPPPGKLSLDIIKSQSHPLLEEALDRKRIVDGVPIPPVETVLALKYLSSTSSRRERYEKIQDIADFGRAFRDNRPRIDRALLVELASKAHQNARAEFEVFLDAIENDRPLTI